MLLNLTEFSDEPIYSQISRQIWEKIISGDLKEQDYLLPVRTLARTHHISPITVEKAYSDLLEEGVITEYQKEYRVADISRGKKREITIKRLFKNDTSLNIIDTFSNRLRSVFEPAKLYEILKMSIQKHFDIQDVFMLIYDSKLGGFKMFTDNESTGRSLIKNNDPFISELNLLDTPAELDNIKVQNSHSMLRDELTNRYIQLIFPLKDEDQILGLIALPGKRPGIPFSKEDHSMLTILANQFVSALITARYYFETVEKRRYEEELTLASRIQQDLLPKELPDNDEIQIAAFSKPSFTIGGDFYDYLPIDDNRFGLVIADACGKGMPAAMLISQIQAILKGEAGSGKPIIEIVKHLNRHIKQYTSARNFTTLFFGIYNRETGVLEYANAGHNYPVIIRRDGSRELLLTTGPALGITTDEDFFTEEVRVNPGDTVLFYTDGLTETMDETGREYSEQRLYNKLAENREKEADEIIRLIINDLNSFSNSEEYRDDTTMLLFRVLEQEAEIFTV
ncbi:SpoIIE family protein phosphatase [candidate division KSB1 bacterium]